MNPFEIVVFSVVGLGLTFAAVAAVIRIVRGPSILDRMVASDVLLTTVMLALGVDMVVREHTDSIPLMIAISSTATFATIVVARYVKRRADFPLPDSPAPDTAEPEEFTVGQTTPEIPELHEGEREDV